MVRERRSLLPRRQRTHRFALTPLADAMFQLLIFFMLSSSLTPYSLLTVQSGPAVDGAAMPAGAQETSASPAAGPTGDVQLWTLEADALLVGGQRFSFSALGDLAQALVATGPQAEVILIVRPSARVQDVSTVLAELRLADVTNIQITSGAL